MFGLVLAIVLFISCLSFGLVRLCGGCGASIKKKPEQRGDKTKRIVLSVVVFLLVALVL